METIEEKVNHSLPEIITAGVKDTGKDVAALAKSLVFLTSGYVNERLKAPNPYENYSSYWLTKAAVALPPITAPIIYAIAIDWPGLINL